MSAKARLEKFLPFFAALLLLGGCEDGTLPKWITGEPTRAEIAAAPQPVPLPPQPASDAPYPNLADVPPRPQPQLNDQQRAAEMDELKKENATGQAEIQQYVAENPNAAAISSPAGVRK